MVSVHVGKMLRHVCGRETSGRREALRGWRSYGKNKETRRCMIIKMTKDLREYPL